MKLKWREHGHVLPPFFVDTTTDLRHRLLVRMSPAIGTAVTIVGAEAAEELLTRHA